MSLRFPPGPLPRGDLEIDPKTDGQLAVWYMNDVTVLGTAMLDPVRPTDPKYRVVATGDFGRACSVDILLQRKSTRTAWGADPCCSGPWTP